MSLPSTSVESPVRGATAGTVVAPSAQRCRTGRIAVLAVCADGCTDNATLPEDVVNAWQCDLNAPPEPRVSATATGPDDESDTRLMLIVGLSSGAGWLARGMHRD